MATSAPFRILGLCGSLRRASFNAGALRAARDLAPPDIQVSIADLSDFPLYDDDLRARGLPRAVERLGEAIRQSDALLFSSPEYNYSVSSVLKTAIDWISRLPDRPYQGMSGAMMGVSGGGFGTVRAQFHLRQICVFLDIRLINKPELLIGQGADRFDASGTLTDTETGDRIVALLESLKAHARGARGAAR